MDSHQTLTLVGKFHVPFAHPVSHCFLNTVSLNVASLKRLPAEHDGEELQDRVDRLRNGALD